MIIEWFFHSYRYNRSYYFHDWYESSHVLRRS